MERIAIVDIIVENDEGKVLMFKRNFYPVDKLDFLGGYVDEWETIEQAAIREANEESGFEVKLIKKLWAYDYIDRGEKTSHIFLWEIIGWSLQAGKEGTPVRINLSDITRDDLAFPQMHIAAIHDFLKLKNLDTSLWE